jgi:hypothetical protein
MHQDAPRQDTDVRLAWPPKAAAGRTGRAADPACAARAACAADADGAAWAVAVMSAAMTAASAGAKILKLRRRGLQMARIGFPCLDQPARPDSSAERVGLPRYLDADPWPLVDHRRRVSHPP